MIVCRGASLAVLAGCMMVAGAVRPAGASDGSSFALVQAGGQDEQIQADVNKAISNKHLREVKGQVSGGVVTLTGTVTSFQDKHDAGKKARKVKNIVRVENQIQVNGPEVSDQELGQKLANKLRINNLDPDRTAFEIVNLNVQDGAVTLKGFVILPVDKDDAEGIVASTPGVKDLVNQIMVAPPLPNDDRIRRDVFRAIYGYQTFTRYALDPGKSIRILVLNGNLTLAGVVDSSGDKEIAGIRANGVSGVFKVTNDLQVAGQRRE